MAVAKLSTKHPHIRAGRIADLLLICWAGPPDAEVVSDFSALLKQMRNMRPKGFALLHAIDHQQPPAPMEVRRELVRCQDEVATHLRGAAAAIATPGLSGAMLRGVMTGMIMLARKPYPRRITGTLPAAYEWFRGLGVMEDCEYEELSTFAGELRASFAK